MIKNNKTVADYNKKRKCEMLKFNCLNNASQVIASFHSKDTVLQHHKIADEILNLAKFLFAEVDKQDYLELKKKDNKFDFIYLKQ